MHEELLRRWRDLQAWLVYRFDRMLEWPPLAQVAIVALLTALVVVGFAGLAAALDGGTGRFADDVWWSLTHFADGGTMAADPPGRRVAAALVTGAGILVLSLLTASLTSKMGERITQMRGGLLPVVTRDHVLVLGYAPNTPLLVRELARSRQAATVVVLAPEDKARVELSVRTARNVPGQRLGIVVRTGDPRYELALVRVAADHARAIVVIPPATLSDEESVRWTLGVLLALHRVIPETWPGRVLVEARHEEARELLELAVEPEIAGPGALPIHVVATDRLVAQILAQSTRQDGIYFVLRHLLAFDGCEVYVEPVPAELVGASFDRAHARVNGAILVGTLRGGEVLLAPADGTARLEATDRLVVVSDGHGRHRLDGALPAPRGTVSETPSAGPESVVVLGHNATLPHLLVELGGLLPDASSVAVLSRAASDDVDLAVERAALAFPRLSFTHEVRSAIAMAREGSEELCGADAIVVLGEEGADDVNGDASALAMLLRLRKALRTWSARATAVGGERSARLVTEVRDPRSAVHVEPRPGDAVVSSDVVAMLLAQGVLDPLAFPVYDELLGPEGARIVLRPRRAYVEGPATFADVMATARASGEIALGLYPDPRPHPTRDRLDRRRLEEGDTGLGEEAWLNPPRETPVPESASSQIVALVPGGGRGRATA